MFSNILEIPKLYCDNNAAISFAKSPVENARTKHIDVRLHFIRDLVNEKLFDIEYVNTKLNLADYFTKAQVKSSLEKFLKIIKIHIFERHLRNPKPHSFIFFSQKRLFRG